MLSLEIPRLTSLGLYENLLHTSRTLPRTWPPSSTPKSVASEKKRGAEHTEERTDTRLGLQKLLGLEGLVAGLRQRTSKAQCGLMGETGRPWTGRWGR